jgi:serine/threonine protein kinase
MQYLHKKRVIYRDLKPANVGFDANGTIKLFDFGLALEIVESGRRMTPTSGSLRYMSPENVRSGDYDFSADVYSFGVLLWEVLTLETPFMGMASEVILDVVVKSGVRPKLDAQVGCKSLQSIIRQCWDSRPETRP